MTAAVLSSSATAIQINSEMMPGTTLPPDYVILFFEAEKLEEAGDYEAAAAKKAEAIEAKRAGMEAYKKSKEE